MSLFANTNYEVPEFKVVNIKNEAYAERQAIYKDIIKMTGHNFWTIKKHCDHVHLDNVSRFYHEAKGNASHFYQKLKPFKK